MAGDQIVQKAKDYTWLKVVCLFIGISSLVVAGAYFVNIGYSFVPIAIICIFGVILSLVKIMFGGEWKTYTAFMNTMATGLGGLILAAVGLGLMASPVLVYFAM